MRSSLFALGLAALSLSACSASTDTAADDTSEDAVSTNRNSGYFMVTRADARRCASPLCGGYFVKRVNASKTPCADGVYRDECYVSQIDLTGLSLSSSEVSDFNAKLVAGGGIVRASIHKFTFGGNHLGNLVATEGWKAATGSPATGDFYRVADNGIRCVRAPCPSTSADKLNSTKTSNVTRVDFTSTDLAATTANLDAAGTALGTHDGVLVSGTLALPKCIPSNTSCGPTIITNEFFLRVTHSTDTLGQSCGGRGQQMCATGQYCSWAPAAICGRADAAGTCTVRPELCIELYRPVCGCDGQTYSNSCFAAAAGASVATNAACPAP